MDGEQNKKPDAVDTKANPSNLHLSEMTHIHILQYSDFIISETIAHAAQHPAFVRQDKFRLIFH